MVEWRSSGHVLRRPLPRHFQQRLRFVMFEALELRDLRSGEPVGHLAPSSDGVVGCAHGMHSVAIPARTSHGVGEIGG